MDALLPLSEEEDSSCRLSQSSRLQAVCPVPLPSLAYKKSPMRLAKLPRLLACSHLESRANPARGIHTFFLLLSPLQLPSSSR